MAKRPTPEIVVGLIGAAGAPLDEVVVALTNAFSGAGYEAFDVRLSRLIEDMGADDATKLTGIERTRALMEMGTDLRKKTGLGYAVAALGIARIKHHRGGATPRGAKAYIVRSLKHKAEVDELRRIYGRQFVALGVHCPRKTRAERLCQKFALESGGRAAGYAAAVESLLSDDEHESEKLGQRVREAFPKADFFISSQEKLEDQVVRWLDLMLERPVVTPTRDEAGMFQAFAASLSSAALGRQVGAAICSPAGDLRAVGFNEVPCAGGGQHWDGSEPDGRDFRAGFDRSDAGKAHALREVIAGFRDSQWLSETLKDVRDEELLDRILEQADGAPTLREASLLNLTEFTRDVHAETAALLSAARQGVVVRDCVMYATTFPCHNCAKHIIGAGIDRVVYVEPYAKSYAFEFYGDTISVDQEIVDRVAFVPFRGVAPRRYVDWFQMVMPRKDGQGRTRTWLRAEAVPYFVRLGIDPTYVEREDDSLVAYQKAVANN